MAIEHDLEIIPVLNKIDLDSAMPDEVEDQIVQLLGCDRSEIIRASGKTGQGVEEILQTIVRRVPPPAGDPDAPLQALIFDSVSILSVESSLTSKSLTAALVKVNW